MLLTMNFKQFRQAGLVALTMTPLLAARAQSSNPPPAQPAPAVTAPASANLPAGAAEALKLAQAGMSDDVVLAFVKNSPGPYRLSADNIVTLKQGGVSSQVIAAMLSHDKGAPSQSVPVPASPPAANGPVTYEQKLYAPAGQPTPAPQYAPQPLTLPATPAPAVPNAAPAAAPPQVVVEQAPPPPQVEVVPVTPGPGFYWTPGYWAWRHGGWVWVGGVWVVPPRHSAVWVGGHWGRHGHGYIWIGGRWE